MEPICTERDESQLEKMMRVAEHGPRTLDAKWLDPECWDGCQSLVYKHKLESLSSQLAVMKEALEKISNYDGEPIWMDDRDDAANEILEIARSTIDAARK